MRGASSVSKLYVPFETAVIDNQPFLLARPLHQHASRLFTQTQLQRPFSSDESDNSSNRVGRFLKYLTGKEAESSKSSSSSGDNPNGSSSSSSSSSNSGSSSSAAASDAASSSSSGAELIPSNPESRYRDVLAVPLPRRPLFPGGIMPVTVQNPALIQELVQLKRQGAQAYVGAFLRRSDSTLPTEPSFASTDDLLNASEAATDADMFGAQGADRLYSVGTFAQVHTIAPHDQGAQLLLLGHRRIRSTGIAATDPLRLSILHLKDEAYEPGDDTLKATTMEIISTLKELLHLHPLYNEQMRNFIQFGADFHDLSRLADLSASLTSGEASALQEVLEELSVPERASQALLLLKKEAELCKLQADIGRRVEEKISKDQRRYFLMEQLKSIKKELGLEKDEKTALIQKFRERLEPVKDSLPEEASKVIEEELEKLSSIEPASSEFNVTRNYLDWLTSLPWGQSSEEVLDVVAARKVLDEDHYGLDDVKQRILEFIAVGRLKGTTQGKVLCLVGPPGVGKTSIGHSIARALDRKFYRFSVGGLSDVAEIKGHRRTYVGAMPGKAVQCLKATGVSNPLVLIDEIDKLGRGYQGDPASALLELLDPEQNSGFLDHYLDVPVDLSRVLFVSTANVLDTVPGPLLDRMEVIRLSGYIFDEKVAIARRYLEPQCREASGVPEGALEITDAAMAVLVDDYAREAGVRNLKNQLEKIYRKSALKLVQQGVEIIPADSDDEDSDTEGVDKSESVDIKVGEEIKQQVEQGGGVSLSSILADEENSSKEQEEKENLDTNNTTASTADDNDKKKETEKKAVAAKKNKKKKEKKQPTIKLTSPALVVDVNDLKEYLGQPPYPSDKIYSDHMPAGVVTGLAWTALGGSTLYIEAASIESGEGKGGLKATGQLGDVMRESTTIAHTFARRLLEKTDPGNHYFSEHSLHVHVPAGATPKDGPSAGCTVVTALMSLALDMPVRKGLAMTGEVTLTGKVLPIGGLKEKALAAKRSEIEHVIFPEGNRRDWEELTDDVKAGLQPHFVEEYEEIFKIAFPDAKVPPSSSV